jgi:hypothetical protein
MLLPSGSKTNAREAPGDPAGRPSLEITRRFPDVAASYVVGQVLVSTADR